MKSKIHKVSYAYFTLQSLPYKKTLQNYNINVIGISDANIDHKISESLLHIEEYYLRRTLKKSHK